MSTSRKAYGSDVTDAEWAFLLPYLCLMREDAPQREHPLRELFNALRYMVKTGVTWRYLPNDFPPWTAVYQQARRRLQSRAQEEERLQGPRGRGHAGPPAGPDRHPGRAGA